MAAVISSVRAAAINGPGLGGAALGDAFRPTYQVLVSEETAAAAKKKFQDGKDEAKRTAAASSAIRDGQGSFLGVVHRK